MPEIKTLDTRSTQHDASTDLGGFLVSAETPGLLVVHTPLGAAPTDRCLVEETLSMGRSRGCDLIIQDRKVSSRHFQIFKKDNACFVEDLDSTNGTYLDGLRISGKVRLRHQAVIRAGECIFVFHNDAVPMMRALPAERFGMAGQFHTPLLVRQIEEAASSGRNILVAGESGTGKELAARAFARVMGKSGGPLPLWEFNAARFASREEAASTLFGVVPRFFSGVDAREGLIEQATGGVLFIDEIHNLPEQTQRMLLRVIEDGKVTRLGESRPRQVDVRFILSSNDQGATCGLARDLFARLRLLTIEPLSARVADIPSLFKAILLDMLKRRGVHAEEIVALMTTDHMEALCLEDFSAGNVRMLVDLADRITTRALSARPRDERTLKSLRAVFGERFGAGVVARRRKDMARVKSDSPYEQNRDLIVAVYRENERNLSQTVRDLNAKGCRFSRRWIGVFLEKWGEKSNAQQRKR